MLVRVHGSNASVLAVDFDECLDFDSFGICNSICMHAPPGASVAWEMAVLQMLHSMLEEIGSEEI